jgi:hypothetical protein
MTHDAACNARVRIAPAYVEARPPRTHQLAARLVLRRRLFAVQAVPVHALASDRRLS